MYKLDWLIKSMPDSLTDFIVKISVSSYTGWPACRVPACIRSKNSFIGMKTSLYSHTQTSLKDRRDERLKTLQRDIFYNSQICLKIAFNFTLTQGKAKRLLN